MKVNKIMSHIRSISKDVKKQNQTPSQLMSKLMHYTLLADRAKYGGGMIKAFNFFDKGHNHYGLINTGLAKLVMQPKHFYKVVQMYKPTDFFIVLINIHTLKTRKVNYNDVINAQHRILKAKKTIEAKDKYDPNNKLEIERDLDNNQITLTEQDIIFVMFAYYKSTSKEHSKALNEIVHDIHMNMNGLEQKHSSCLDEKHVSAILKLLKQTKSRTFKEFSSEDKKDWHRLFNKLTAWLHHIKKEDSVENPLLQKAIFEMHKGNVTKSLDTLLTHMTIDHMSGRNTCYDYLSRVAINTMSYGINYVMFACLDDLMTGTKMAANDGDEVQAKDYNTLKAFSNKGHKYALITFNDDDTIHQIEPIDKSAGLLILQKIINNYRNHHYPKY